MRNRFFPCTVRCFLFSLLCFTLCFAPATASAATVQQQLTAGVPASFPPEYNVDLSTGRPFGFAIDFMDAVAGESGMTVRYLVFNTWQEVNQAMREGKIDLIPLVGVTAERQQWLRFTRPVTSFAIGVFVRSPEQKTLGPGYLDRGKICAVTGNKGYFLLKERGVTGMVVSDAPGAALFDLLTKKCDALVYPAPAIQSLAGQARLANRIKLVDTLATVKRAMAIRPGLERELAALDAAVERVVSSPGYAKILARWYPQSTFWTARTVTIVAVIALFLLYAFFTVLRQIYMSRAEKAIEEKSTITRLVLENTSDGFWMVGSDGRILQVNRAYEEMSGYSAEELLKMRINDIDAVARPEETVRRIAAIRTAGFDRFETRHRKKDGTLLYLDVAVNVAESEGKQMLFSFMRDITSRIEAEKREKEVSDRLNRDLAKQVEGRTRELAEANKKLVVAEKLAALGQIAGSVSHDLRNPLGVMANSLYFLTGTLGGTDEKITRHLAIIQREIKQATDIISELFDFSRSTEGRPLECEPAEIVRAVLDSALAPQGVEIVSEIQPGLSKVFVDFLQMVRALRNLVNNAFEVLEKNGGRVILSAAREGDGILFQVEDNGPGMTPEAMGRIFEPLYTTKSRGGIGLGLAIVERYVAAAGGVVRVKSAPGRGTVFGILLPRAGGAGLSADALEVKRPETDGGSA